MPTPTNIRDDAIYSVYIDTTTVKVRNNATSAIDYTADNTVNAVTAINSAINNIKNITNAGIDSTYGARINIAAGVYKCTTNLLVSEASGSANREGIALVGEGPGTVLNFVPSGALTDGVKILDKLGQIEDMRIVGNTNVTNLLTITSTTPVDSYWQGSRGKINKVWFEGARYTTDFAYTAGQVGILINGPDGVTPTTPYEWRITNCDFVSLDIGVKATGINSTSTFQDNNSFQVCNVGVDIDSAQHTVTNVIFQGESIAGSSAIRLRSGALYNTIDNIITEMKLSTACQAVLLDSGAAHNMITNVLNSQATGTGITDNSASDTNYMTYFDTNHILQVKVAESTTIANNTAKVGIGNGQGSIDILPVASSSFGFFRVVPTHSDYGTGATGSGGVGITDTGLRSLFRLKNTSDNTNDEYVEFFSAGTFGYLFHVTSQGNGSLRPLSFGMNGVSKITLNIDGTVTIVSASLDSTNNFSTTATTASTGANGAPPAQVAGYITINVGGAAKKIPYYNT